MLGVLKSGCSFLLMDVSHPTSRLQTLAHEVKATLILSSSAQSQRAANIGSHVISVSRASFSTASKSVSPHVEVGSSAVAAVVFTSGTTGTPKGIQLEHRSICSNLLALAKLAGVTEQTRYFQFSSYAFDAGFGEILMTLISGGCVCIPSEEDRLNNLAQSIRAFDATTVLLTPTVVRLLSPSDVPCLTTLISGGERVTQDIIGTWCDKLDLIIVYGPAETTVTCIAKKALPTTDSATRVGSPLNSRVWITLLDDPSKLAPVGAIGELVVEGPGVARNYINSVSESAHLFYDIAPWAQEWEMSLDSMGRCYRTGDMAYFADDGEIVFVGRRDRQVKLHGQRIELEDIEIKLQHRNQISGSQIILEVLNIHSEGDLVVFFHAPDVLNPSGTTSGAVSARMTKEMELQIEKLRVRILEELPRYMWPIIWIPLQKLPLGPTGKLDRKLLLRYGKDYCSSMTAYEGFHDDLSPIESLLAKIWRQTLNAASLKLKSDAHFFRMGGDSLSAMKLVSSVSKEGYHLTMDKIFRNPTLHGMAVVMQEIPYANPHSALVSQSHSPSRESFQGDWSLLENNGLIRDEVEHIVPCTALQEGLFSLSLALPSLYFSQFIFRFSSAVRIDQFKAALMSAVQAHPVLRTAIIPSSSRLLQVILQEGANWTEVTQDLPSFLSTDKARSFDSGQLLNRIHQVQDSTTNETHIVWTLHHAIFDGWSLDVVVKHLLYHYNRISEKTAFSGHFQEFVAFCDSLNKTECEDFWTKQLEDAPASSFPDFSKSGHLTKDDSSLRHTMLDPTESILGIPTTILARATWALLLSEYEGSDDVTFGNSLHGRNSLPHHLQDVVGPTVTTLPIRTQIDRSQSISSFIDSVQKQFSAMVPYEQFGLSRIQAISSSLKNAASFRTLLIVQVENAKSIAEEDIKLDEVERSLHEYPLVLTLEPKGPHIEIVATFDKLVISSWQAQRILTQFEQTFHRICSVPTDTMLGDLDLASSSDKSIMFQRNACSHNALEICVHDLITEQVRCSPNSPAIYFNHTSMSYASLDTLSDRLAGELRRAGVESGSAVGVLFEKSPWAIVSILAIIKAGCAFAPLSPTNPRRRLEDIAHEANIGVVLCSPQQEALLSNPPWRAIVVTEEAVRSFEPVLSAPATTPDSLLYFLSTSGTTGTPKVFAVQHKSFATGAVARAPVLKRGPKSRVLQFAPYVFDPSVEDILTTLIFGGCICAPSDEDILGDITAYMKMAGVNFANITPSVAHTLRPNELPDLDVLLLSGEAPDQALIDKWDGKVQLMNGYGPSECSVKCSINPHLSRKDSRNIGYSIGTNLWVVKPTNHNLLTPLGAIGELVIESPSLATGYLNPTASTDNKFITSPEWLRPLRDDVEARLYKTGDLVQVREDGSIVYIGRADQQLKINGQRLEGEEVRQRIQECLRDEQLQVIVDTARFQGQETDVLIAYLAREGTSRSESIVTRLRGVLPAYMIPSVFLAVTNIPVTRNGKTDRRALRAQTLHQRLGPDLLFSGESLIQAPISERERIQHKLWQKLLGLNEEQFGANSNFFELGGNSLTAIKLAAAVREMGYSLPAQQIYRLPVLSTMAKGMTPLKQTKKAEPTKFDLLKKIGRTTDELKECLSAYDIDHLDVEDAYPCTKMQKIFTREEMIAPGGNTFRHIVPLPPNLDLVKLTSAVESIVRTNSLLRTRYILLGSDLVQIVVRYDATHPKVELFTELEFKNHNVSWALGEPQSRFSIVTGGDFKARFLAWSCAHSMFDPWSRRMLLEDLDWAYHHNDVPVVRPQYNNFVEYAYNLKTNDMVRALAQKVEHGSYFRYFTFDNTRVPQVTHRLCHTVKFPAALPNGTSYATLVTTAWAIVAAYIEGHKQLLFNVMLGGRDAEFTGVDRLSGPTLTIAPLAMEVNSSSTVFTNLENVQRSIDEAVAIQHSPELDDKLQQSLASVPLIMVHPADDYVEAPTKHLGLVRSHAEVRPSADALIMNLCLHTGNTGVDLLAEIDPTFISVEKTIMYFGYLEQVLVQIVSPGGLAGVVSEIDLGSGLPTKSVSISTDQSWGTSDIGGPIAAHAGEAAVAVVETP
ncbi:nrps [Curvularia kusanoi]|uniref:Nrps n=1 Tax=Curvularia kusanoi TaxID=90978 RepID=A0A9P4W9T5_CURKU|nr:nrps [Curvularia kusanoi]